MLTLLTALLVTPAPPPARRDTVPDVPSIQITLSSNGDFAPGEKAKVQVETRDDGYLVVFRVDGDGRIRVLFPIDPDDDPFVRGGHRYELLGRDDREAFMADDRPGGGLIYAAVAPAPMAFGGFATDRRWDYDVLRLRDSLSDPEDDLTRIVTRMTNRNRFDYDVAEYRVREIAGGYGYGYGAYTAYDPYYNGCYGCGSINLGLAFGYDPFWDPWFYSPWYYGYPYSYIGVRYPGQYVPYTVINLPRRRPPFPSNTAYGTRARPRPGYLPGGQGYVPGGQGGGRNNGSNPGRDVGSGRNPPAGNSGQAPPSDNGGRSRPRQEPPQRSAPPAQAPAPTARPSSPPAGSGGTRSRPRGGGDEEVTRITNVAPTSAPREMRPVTESRPVFREPPTAAPRQADRPASPPPQQRAPAPVYREPPRADRPSSPPPQQRAPAPAVRQSPPPPPPAPPPASGGGHVGRPRGG